MIPENGTAAASTKEEMPNLDHRRGGDHWELEGLRTTGVRGLSATEQLDIGFLCGGAIQLINCRSRSE